MGTDRDASMGTDRDTSMGTKSIPIPVSLRGLPYWEPHGMGDFAGLTTVKLSNLVPWPGQTDIMDTPHELHSKYSPPLSLSTRVSRTLREGRCQQK
jgi:hypothetical protein